MSDLMRFGRGMLRSNHKLRPFDCVSVRNLSRSRGLDGGSSLYFRKLRVELLPSMVLGLVRDHGDDL